jgi:hypothetical protein
MIAYLRAQQFADKNGWKRDDPPYGAWGMGGEVRRPPEPGHVDLSVTRYVLEALAAAGLKPSDPATQKALVFVELCQNPDGGFYFSPVNPDINKAGDTNGKFNSYGTATADGVLALQAAGVDDADRRIRSAKAWLKAHHRPDAAPGFDVPPYQAWAQGLRFYYAAAVSRAMPELPVLLPPQKSDGSWANSSNLVKEDDPLIATALALRVLNHHRGK